MLTRSAFIERFGRKSVFGMVHLRPLPGSPGFVTPNEVIEAALRDVRALEKGGCNGLVIENFGDRPFTRGRVEAETVAAMTRAVVEIAKETSIPFGVNVLRNDPLSALAIAAATGAAFIRVNVLAGAMVTDQGVIEGNAYETLRKRASLAPHVLVFADHLVKHAVPLAPQDALQSAKDLRLRALADALIVTGKETGAAADASMIERLRVALDAPLLVGSGVSEANAGSFGSADGAIVGTSIKFGGDVDAPVDEARVRAVVDAFRKQS